MSLEEVLKKAVGRIRSGALENEAQVKQAVIVPILRALDWNDSDPDEFKLEFSVPSGRVDYALLRQGDSPLVFIEAKSLGKMDTAGEEQVFQYATNRGVPFLILTDGDIWDFYLAMAAGVPADRRFYRAELTREERIPEYVEIFERHLRKSQVVSGKARQEAERRHESARERATARKAIPGVWRKLLEVPDEMLRDLLIEETEKDCGTKPEADDVERFLKGLLNGGVIQTQKPPSSPSTASAGKVEKSPPSAPPEPKDPGKSNKWNIPPEAIRLRHELHRSRDEWEHLIAEFMNQRVVSSPISIAEVGRQALDVRSDKLDKKMQMRIAECLKNLGFRKKRFRDENGNRPTLWIKDSLPPEEDERF